MKWNIAQAKRKSITEMRMCNLHVNNYGNTHWQSHPVSTVAGGEDTQPEAIEFN
jgi:hypothetical protein